MEYLDFRNLVTEACNKMIKENKHLFILDTQKEFLWMAYMESFLKEPCVKSLTV